MLKKVNGRNMSMECNHCDNEHTHKLPVDFVCNKNPIFSDEYENLAVTCPQCGALEIFNLNIPTDDTDEPFETGDLPVEEEVQRYYVRLLQREIRADFRGVKR